MLSQQDIIFIYDLIGRAQISGNEADAVVSLKKKLQLILAPVKQEAQQKAPETPEKDAEIKA